MTVSTGRSVLCKVYCWLGRISKKPTTVTVSGADHQSNFIGNEIGKAYWEKIY